MSENKFKKQFAEDILEGLSAEKKFIPSKYFYDDTGSKLFQEIMSLDEYYLTNCEYELLENYKNRFLKIFSDGQQHFNLIEFGAGDGYKTKILLEHFMNNYDDFTYMPIDISKKALDILESRITEELPDLDFRSIHNDYFAALHDLKERERSSRNVVLFLGSTIGNFSENEALKFLNAVKKELKSNDLFVIGFDLKKHPQVILDAYNDSKGITKEFNMNLLRRMNNELGADFKEDNFMHFPSYNPETGETKSFLISRKSHNVYFEYMDKTIDFNAFESIYTEVSQKYDSKYISKLADISGFNELHTFYDEKEYFAEVIWRVK
jgi:dimethylhistidine N-methyltransferase